MFALAAPALAGEKADARQARRLVAILRTTTQSPAAFALTLKFLKDTGGDLRHSVPDAVRAAERLGIFSRDPLKKLPANECTRVVTEMIEELGRKAEAEVAEKDRDHRKDDIRLPVLHRIIPGELPPVCEDPPEEADVLRAWKNPRLSVPGVCEEFYDNIQIVPELIVDKIEPARFFPVVGMANLHHCHWKVSIYYDETIETSFPFPFKFKRTRADVLYMDLDHLHLCAGAQ